MHPVQPQIDRLRRRHVGRGGHLLGVVSGGVTTSGGGKMAEVWVGVEVEVKVVWGAVTQTQDGGGGQHTDAERRQVRSDNGTRHLRYGEPSNIQTNDDARFICGAFARGTRKQNYTAKQPLAECTSERERD